MTKGYPLKFSSLQDYLEQNSINYSVMAKKVVWKLQQKWRETFSQKVKEQKGKWVYRGFDWHTFSYDFAIYKSGARAMGFYSKIDERNYIIISEDSDSPSFSCSSDKLPDLSNVLGDYYIYPETVEWTMVFTHEESLGPYFALKEWQ